MITNTIFKLIKILSVVVVNKRVANYGCIRNRSLFRVFEHKH